MVSLALGKARVELAPEVGGAIAEFTFAGRRRSASDAA